MPARHNDRTASGFERWKEFGGPGSTAGLARALYSAEVTAATRREVAVTTLRPAPRKALVLRAPRAGQTRAFMVAEADMLSRVFRWCPGEWRARLFGARYQDGPLSGRARDICLRHLFVFDKNCLSEGLDAQTRCLGCSAPRAVLSSVLPTSDPVYTCGLSRLEGPAASVCAAPTLVPDGPYAWLQACHG